jgi:hypothetical protein
VKLQYLCYHNTFVSAIIHNTFATIPLSTIPYTGVPWERELVKSSGADLKAAAAELDAERQKTAELAEKAEMNAMDLAATKQD